MFRRLISQNAYFTPIKYHPPDWYSCCWSRFRWLFHVIVMSCYSRFLQISWKNAFSTNVSQLRALWISMFSHRGSLGKPLGGPFSSNVSHYRPVGPLGCCIKFYRRKSPPRLNLHTVLAFRHIFWALGGHMFALAQGCWKSRSRVFDDCFKFSACRAVIVFFYFLQKYWNLSMFPNC